MNNENSMKTVITIEEVAMFSLAVLGFSQLSFAWWVFLVLLLAPDLSMLGYLISTKIGAITYNIIHHKALAIAMYITGCLIASSGLQLIGIILFAHSCMDRAFGYGLKYFTGFKHTHLGMIGQHK